jgi:hypothetical protein
MITIKTQTPHANRTTVLPFADSLPFVLCDIIAAWSAIPIKEECTFTRLSLVAEDDPGKKAQIEGSREHVLFFPSVMSCYLTLTTDVIVVTEAQRRRSDERQQRIWVMQTAVILWIMREHQDNSLAPVLAGLPLLTRYRWAANIELAKTMDTQSCVNLFSQPTKGTETK